MRECLKETYVDRSIKMNYIIKPSYIILRWPLNIAKPLLIIEIKTFSERTMCLFSSTS